MKRIPVHVVAGAAGSGKSALIARLVRSAPDWLGLVNTLPEGTDRKLKLLAQGCPCCTGRLLLQVTLARALRETGAKRAFVELPDAGHASTLAKLLAEPPFSLSMCSARRIELPGDADITAADLASE